MTTRRELIGAGAASIALTAAAVSPLRTVADDSDDDNDHDHDQATGTRVVGTPTLKPAIDLARAQEIALEGNTGAAVTKIELDGDHGVLEYSIHLDNGVEVDIDATTGVILKTEHDDDGDDHDSNDDDHVGDDDHNDDD